MSGSFRENQVEVFQGMKELEQRIVAVAAEEPTVTTDWKSTARDNIEMMKLNGDNWYSVANYVFVCGNLMKEEDLLFIPLKARRYIADMLECF